MTADRARTAAHELAHALVGRAEGYRIRTVSILPSLGSLGTCEHYQRTDLSPFEDAFRNTVTLLAGDIGGLMVRLPDDDGYVELSEHEADLERLAALAALPADDAAFLAYMRTVPTTGTDETKAEALASVADAEQFAFLYLARARSTRLVTELAPLIAALIPTLLERLVMTGDDIGQAIADLAGTPAPIERR